MAMVVDIGSTGMVTTRIDDLAPVRAGVPQPFSLDWVLHPIRTETFFRVYWEAEPLLTSRSDPDYFAGLPGLDAVDELITTTTSTAARSIADGYMVRTDQNGVRTERTIRLLDNGVPDIQDVYRAYQSGYTVIVNHVEHRSTSVARLCRTLESTLHHRVGANIYLTPQGSQGFPPHVDDHDVFILQLHGVKEWHVSDPPRVLPLAGGKGGPVEFLGSERTYTLSPGDVLYLPRGYPHEATTASSSSLHLTVGINVYTWADLVAEALRLLADDRLEFRRGLPPGFLGSPIDPEQLSDLAGDLASVLADDSLVERAKERLAGRLLGSGKIPDGGQFRSIDAISDLTGESVVRRVPGLLCRAQANDGRASIRFATNYVSGPARLEPAMKFIEEHPRFVVRDLPGQLSDEEQVDLVGRLVGEGLLSCDSNSREREANGDGR